MIPLVRLEVQTRLPPDQVLGALQSRIRSRWNILAWIDNPSFYGWADISCFRVYRSTPFCNGGTAIAVGKVSPAEHGSNVEITLRPPLPTIPLTCLFLGVLISLLLFELSQLVTGRPLDPELFLAAGVFGLGPFLAMLGCFWFDVGRTESALRLVLQQSPES